MRPWIMLAGLNGAVAIGLAAYGAHGVGPAAAPLMEKASQFQLIHAGALIGIDWLSLSGRRWASVSGLFFTMGILLFSGSLYWRAMSGHHIVPLATPAGGLSFIAGWLALAAASLQKGTSSDLT